MVWRGFAAHFEAGQATLNHHQAHLRVGQARTSHGHGPRSALATRNGVPIRRGVVGA